MIEWWESLTLLQQIFTCMAVPATLILIIQSILLLFGIGFGGGDGDTGDISGDFDSDFDTDTSMADIGDIGNAVDIDTAAQYDVNAASDFDPDTSGGDINDTSGLSLFTIRGIVAFFAIGGWTGLVLSKYVSSYIAIPVAFIAGTAALVGIALLFKYAMKFQDKGNIDIKNAIGKTGSVYLTIPANKSGKGKINIMLQERFVELDAVTNNNQPILTGSIIEVNGIIDQQTVLVNKQGENSKISGGGISKWIH